MVKIKEIKNFKSYGKCIEITNGIISALITVDIGPRIIGFGFCGSQNFMNSEREKLGGRIPDEIYTDYFGKGRKWENLGGHRIWLSPESYPETYTPDDKPVDYIKTDCGAVFTQKPDFENGVVKQLEIEMSEKSADIKVVMSVKNISDTPKEFSVWALSVCEKGGTLIIPTNTNDTGLLPNRVVSVWSYTDMSCDDIYFGKKYVTVRQHSEETPEGFKMKLGFDLNCGTVYYALGEELFCKKYGVNHKDGKYPDGGCSFETYNCNEMIEIESLSELKTVAPGETSIHTENWSLCKKPCEVDFKNDGSIDDLLNKM